MPTPTQLRRSVAGLSALAARDLDVMWRKVTTAAQARRALSEILPALIETYGLAAAALAADWYDEARAEARVAGSFVAWPRSPGDPTTSAESLLGWADRDATSIETMPVLVAGGVQRRIANAARWTVMGAAIADPKAEGWVRVGSPACKFCRDIIARGTVYTASSATFDAHDHCNCAASPKWTRSPVLGAALVGAALTTPEPPVS